MYKQRFDPKELFGLVSCMMWRCCSSSFTSGQLRFLLWACERRMDYYAHLSQTVSALCFWFLAPIAVHLNWGYCTLIMFTEHWVYLGEEPDLDQLLHLNAMQAASGFGISNRGHSTDYRHRRIHLSGTDVLFVYHQGVLLRDAGRSLAMVEPRHQADCCVARPCPHGCAYGVGLTLNKKKVVAWCGGLFLLLVRCVGRVSSLLVTCLGIVDVDGMRHRLFCSGCRACLWNQGELWCISLMLSIMSVEISKHACAIYWEWRSFSVWRNWVCSNDIHSPRYGRNLLRDLVAVLLEYDESCALSCFWWMPHQQCRRLGHEMMEIHLIASTRTQLCWLPFKIMSIQSTPANNLHSCILLVPCYPWTVWLLTASLHPQGSAPQL